MRKGTKADTVTQAFVEEVCGLLKDGKPVRRELPFGGRLHIERQLPFLCVYRDPVGRLDLSTERMISGEAAHLITTAHASQSRKIRSLIEQVAETMAQQFGGFLILELWAGEEVQEDEHTNPEAVRPAFRIFADEDADEKMQRVHEALEARLRRIRVQRKAAEVKLLYGKRVHPPGMSPLISKNRLANLSGHALGLEVQPVYRNSETGEEFPIVLRMLHRGLSRALRQAFFAFIRMETTARPRHYHSLGPRSINRAVWETDRKLAEIAESFDFLFQVTPINITPGWHAFRRRGFQRPPVCHYRPLPVDPLHLKRNLYAIDIDRVEDPTLGALFREQRDELDRQLTMLADRNTSRFLYGSFQLYGRVESTLLKTAKEILRNLVAGSSSDDSGGSVRAETFARLARDEIERFRRVEPRVNSKVVVTETIAGLMVSRGNLLVGSSVRFAASRVEALVQHEVGTHVLTYWNGKAQRFRLLSTGWAGYDELQEGLAVLSEHLVGGLNSNRLRLLAGRVIAASCMQDGAGFVETFRQLCDDHDFRAKTAYMITSRIYRGGGLTKDAVYLRGLVELLDFISKNGEIKTLYAGKVGRQHVPIINELQIRRIILPPRLIPSYMRQPAVQQRLKKISQGVTPIELVNSGYKKARNPKTVHP
jgi:uncharacterized protein (TIGR02421 family)